MADYIGTATGQQLDALPNKVSQLEQKVGEFTSSSHDDICDSIETIEGQLSGIETLLASI